MSKDQSASRSRKKNSYKFSYNNDFKKKNYKSIKKMGLKNEIFQLKNLKGKFGNKFNEYYYEEKIEKKPSRKIEEKRKVSVKAKNIKNTFKKNKDKFSFKKTLKNLKLKKVLNNKKILKIINNDKIINFNYINNPNTKIQNFYSPKVNKNKIKVNKENSYRKSRGKSPKFSNKKYIKFNKPWEKQKNEIKLIMKNFSLKQNSLSKDLFN